MRTILVTGGAGFIGANLVNYLSEKYPEDRIVVLDILTYAGSVENLPKDMLHGQHPLRRFWYGNVCNAALVDTLVEDADVVIHLAAETHVTRSIFDSLLFFQTDVLGMSLMLVAVIPASTVDFAMNGPRAFANVYPTCGVIHGSCVLGYFDCQGR